jgi:hypothetical protein
MKKSKVSMYKNRSGIIFALLLSILGLTTACGGGTVNTGTPTGGGTYVRSTPTQPTIGTIASAVTTAVNKPYIAGNSVQYYCDCTGPGQSCAASTQGNDSTGNGSQSLPYQTLDKGMKWVTGGPNRTLALCQGGSFTTANTGAVIYTFGGNSCPAGSICNEVREYPYQGTNAKPIINSPVTHQLFGSTQSSTNGGWRFMNLKLQGIWDTTSGNHTSWAFFLYTFAANTFVHDISIENVDIDGFDIGIDNATNANNNISLVSSHITNSSQWGYLGGSNNSTISYNSFINNGSGTTFLHTIYFGTHQPVTGVSIIGNFISGFSTAGGATRCLGEPIVGHGAVMNLIVSGNVVVEDTTAGPGCYGISFSNGGAPVAYYRNALFSDNIVVNGGSAGISIDNCPYCAIENNLIIQEANNGGSGIGSPTTSSRTQDDVETNVKIINNTVYLGINNNQGMNGGIKVGAEGAGHIVANNTVMYAGSSHALNSTNCFDYLLPLSSYSFINNNNCFTNDPGYVWVQSGSTRYSMLNWVAYAASAGTGFDTASSYVNPGWLITNPLTIPALDETKTGAQIFATFFTPAGLPLVGTGNAANAPTSDIANTTRPITPSIGAYE